MTYDSNVFSRLAKVLPPGLSQWIRTRKMRSRVRHHGSETLDRLAARVEQVADLGRIRELRRKMQSVIRTDPTSAAKYTDYPFWLLLNVDRAGRLGLHQTSGLRVMDLGCGPGFFVAAARELGHECRGVDVPESFFTATMMSP